MDKKIAAIVCIVAIVIGIAVYSAQWEGPVVTSSASPNVSDTGAPTKNEDLEGSDTAPISDGKYFAEFLTDSSMFHVNEAMEGKGILSVENGKMMLHISLPSQNILNLYPGLAIDAAKEGAVLYQPTFDSVTYEDGTVEDVNGFDIEVPYLDEEFDLALVGTKGKWYDHKVSVKNPVEYDINKDVSVVDFGEGIEESVDAEKIVQDKTGNNDKTVDTNGSATMLSNHEFNCDVVLSGGSGRAKVSSPCTVKIVGEKAFASIEWSSDKYDYMIVEGEKYLPVNTSGNSVFEIPVLKFNEPFSVIADTTAMGNPHEIEYTLTFDSKSMK